ncbi:MAG: LacI family DNA-binding transcriptional regulator, partial [Tepidisphaeraceae bacterium]
MAARTRPRLVDIAAKAGVSPPVVSTVLRGDGADLAASTSGNIRVAPETAERIRRIAREMNYRPNVTAQLLRGRKSDVIGVLIGVGSPALNFERLAAIEQAAYQRGYRLMVGQFRGDSDRIARYVQDFLDRHVEALICFHNPLPEHDDRVVELLEQIPGLVFQTQSLVEGACRVDVDRAAGATDAVKYLASKGRRRIGL